MPSRPLEPISEPIPNAELMDALSPQRRTRLVAELLATIALRAVQEEQEEHEQSQNP